MCKKIAILFSKEQPCSIGSIVLKTPFWMGIIVSISENFVSVGLKPHGNPALDGTFATDGDPDIEPPTPSEVVSSVFVIEFY